MGHIVRTVVFIGPASPRHAPRTGGFGHTPALPSRSSFAVSDSLVHPARSDDTKYSHGRSRAMTFSIASSMTPTFESDEASNRNRVIKASPPRSAETALVVASGDRIIAVSSSRFVAEDTQWAGRNGTERLRRRTLAVWENPVWAGCSTARRIGRGAGAKRRAATSRGEGLRPSGRRGLARCDPLRPRLQVQYP